MTYTQPAESLGAISTMAYQPRVPASSECSSFTSSAVYTSLASPTKALTSAVTSTGASGSSASGTSKGSTSSGTAKSASVTNESGNGSSELAVSLIASFFGVAFAATLLS